MASGKRNVQNDKTKGPDMAIEIRVPTMGESVSEATVGNWFKKVGDAIAADEIVAELETDKVAVEVRSPSAGVLAEITAAKGATVGVGALLGQIREGAAAAAPPAAAQPSIAQAAVVHAPVVQAPIMAGSAPPNGGTAMPPSPAARKAMAEAGLEADDVSGSGRRGQILKSDVATAAAGPKAAATAPSSTMATYAPTVPLPVPAQQLRVPSVGPDSEREKRVPMTRLRQTIARRLKDAQNTAAMLTTFNDVDMGAVMNVRAQYKDQFEKRHGVKLGFMGFFVKACIQALKEIPAVNAEVDGADLIYKNYYHIGVAVGTDKGLVVPVVRDADMLSLAAVEAKIGEYGKKARDGKLGIEDMQGGTFTITNGGVYGSLMSTPPMVASTVH